MLKASTDQANSSVRLRLQKSTNLSEQPQSGCSDRNIDNAYLCHFFSKKRKKEKELFTSITIIIYVYFEYTSFLPWKVEIKRGRLSKFLSHLVIFSTHRLVQVSDKSQSPGECKSRTETNAPRQGLVLRGAAAGWDKGMDYVNAATLSEINFRRSLLSTARPLPSIRGHLWKSLSNFLPCGRGKKREREKKKKLALLLQRPRRVLEDVGRLNFNGSTRNERLTRRKKLVESAALFVVEVQKKKFLELVQK